MMKFVENKKLKAEKCLSIENINPNIVAMEYAVRGPLVIRAGEIEREIEKGVKKPFTETIRANIGGPQSMGQKPITFVRQLLACLYDPSLLHTDIYPEDVKSRAREILNACAGKSIGSLGTDAAGISVIRKQVAKYIEKRDGVPSDWNHIFLTAGTTLDIKSVIALMRANEDGRRPGIMIPIPQYPLYSATITEYGVEKIGYYLNESTNWGLDREELQRSYDEAKCEVNPRAIVVINPGNPTGQVLTRENIEEIIKFAYENKLVILTDEVFQHNIHDENSKFYSFKKVLYEMGVPYRDMELFSFMSVSKGFICECDGAGILEVFNICPKVLAMLTKSLTASICGRTAGQAIVGALVNPPQPNEPSYECYIKERNARSDSLREGAELIYKMLNSFEGLKLNVVQGGLCVFPRIDIPLKAIEAAKAKNMPADTFYAFELLEATGICIVPGNGFGQQPGTYHFRTTILPQTDKLKEMMKKWQAFHVEFMEKYN